MTNEQITKTTQNQKPIAQQKEGLQNLTRQQVSEALLNLRGFVGFAQRQVISVLSRGEERSFFYGKLIEIENIVATMPKTYETDGQGSQAVAHLHYFTANADWYITESDSMFEQLQAFGMADLGYEGELGYISIVELIKNGAELDLHWTPKTLGEIKSEKAMNN